MKQSIVFLLFAFFFNSTICKSQDDRKGLYVGVLGSIDYAGLHVNGGDEGFRTAWNDLSKPRVGYTTGVIVLDRISNLFALEYGLLYSKKGFRTEMEVWTIEPDPLFPNGGKLKTTYDFHYLEVPVKANFYLLQKKLQLYISAGASANILMESGNSVKLQTKDIYTNTSDDYKPLGVNLLASVGLEIPMLSKTTIRVEPIFRRSLSKVNKSGDVKWYVYNPGLNLGVFYKL
ncbi:hypothetical protein MYP_1131 [Sporocytophaga myxococcoides]|uniref:Outer membrane protein beta-barrel domain-containing protein n=1 Tax=Sporocytophaga myxococcoides TaxID=153721 RepID=A0A098LCP5_9BACT|nr:porin family protein [Sporocytophaga myxococcoides]GAL83903.1 hypothetical protein MYP_1131 [Sporocytophaga myxococcoides]